MRCFQLCWVVFSFFFSGESGWMPSVSGMPLEQRFDGSNLCSFDFGRNAASKEYSRIALDLIYKNTATVVANSTKCDLEFWNGAAQWNQLTGNDKRTFDRIEVGVTEVNPELLKIHVDKRDQGRLSNDVDSIIRIVCVNRKLHGCIRFPSSKKGVIHVHRSLLSVDQLDMQKDDDDDDDGAFLKPLLLASAGLVILVLAGSLCTDCNVNKDDESMVKSVPRQAVSVGRGSDARPHLVSLQHRLSHGKIPPKEEQPEKEVVDESQIDIGTVEKIGENFGAENNHTSKIVLSCNERPESTSSVQHESHESHELHGQHVPPNSTQSPEPASSAHASDPQSRPHSAEHALQHDDDAVQPDTTPSEYETVEPKTVNSKSGSSKSKQGNEHEHDQHKGRFWKRTRSAKGSNGTISGTDRSSDVFKEEERKHRRSRKESKEMKIKTGKTKSRTGSSDSDKDEKHVLHENPVERPRVATPTLERHSRGLPLPPEPSVPPLPVVPIPQRHFSAPDAAEEDNNYETVEVRKTKSMERVRISPPSPSDNAYDTVQVKVGKPRALSLDHDTGEDSGNYEVVACDTIRNDYLYAEVQQAKKKDTTNEKTVEKTVAEEAEDPEDPEDPYSRIKNLKQKEKLAENSEALEEAEDPYSRIKNEEQQEDLEASDLYEDVDKQRKNRADTNHKYASVDKKEVFQLMIDTENSADSERNRTQSDTTGLQRPGIKLDKRANSVHMMRSTKGEVAQVDKVTFLPRDDTYAKVDLSKKSKHRHDTEGSEDIDEERNDTENPPPLPPAYASSGQMRIEMEKIAGNTDNLYDEVATVGGGDHALNTELFVPQDDMKRFSSASGDYEPVEPILKPVYPATKTSANDDYAEILEPGRRSDASGSGSVGPVRLKVCDSPANISVTVTSSKEACADDDNIEETHYELVAPRDRKRLESSTPNG